MSLKGERRPYYAVRLDEPGTVSCQHGGEIGKVGICGAVTTIKRARANLGGGWWNVWECPRGHRFAERWVGESPRHEALDVKTTKPVFGEV